VQFGSTLMAICVIWTSSTNDNMYKVLGKRFIGYQSFVQTTSKVTMKQISQRFQAPFGLN